MLRHESDRVSPRDVSGVLSHERSGSGVGHQPASEHVEQGALAGACKTAEEAGEGGEAALGEALRAWSRVAAAWRGTHLWAPSQPAFHQAGQDQRCG